MPTRRTILLRSVQGAGLALAGSAFWVPLAKAQARAAARADGEPKPPWFFLTDEEASFLEAAVDILIPADEFPSGSEAGVVDYIDMQLATGWGEGEGLYLEGPFESGEPEQGYQLGMAPAELYRQAIAALRSDAGEGGFEGLQLSVREQWIKELSEGSRDAGLVPGKTFFDHLYQNTLEGYFADPVYNGNQDMAGWKMIGFPGAHAYYLTEVDRYNMAYERPPASVAQRLGGDAPEPFTRKRVNERIGS